MPSVEEIRRRHKPNVSPDQYHIKDELVKPTRYSKILAGGSSPKSGMILDKNPGPGEYKEGNSILDIMHVRGKTQSSSFASTLGKSFYHQTSAGSGSGARACAFAMPSSGEPFNDFGFLKAYNHKFRDQ